MWIIAIIIICVIAFIFFDRKNSRSLDEKTLIPMNQWFIIAASSSSRQQRLMCFSVLSQASHLLHNLNIMSASEFKAIIKTPGFNPANFVYALLDEANKINSDPNINTFDLQLVDMWNSEQARVYIMNTIIVILTKKTALFPGIHQLVLLAKASSAPQLNWKSF